MNLPSTIGGRSSNSKRRDNLSAREQNKNQELRVGQEPLQTGFYYAETCFLGRVIKLGECFQHALLANVQSSDILSEGYCKGSLI